MFLPERRMALPYIMSCSTCPTERKPASKTERFPRAVSTPAEFSSASVVSGLDKKRIAKDEKSVKYPRGQAEAGTVAIVRLKMARSFALSR
jgi:hypothetical protein